MIEAEALTQRHRGHGVAQRGKTRLPPYFRVMLESNNCTIDQLAIHYAGNKTNGESLVLSDELMDIADLRLKDLLVHYFMDSLSGTGYYSFTFSNGDHSLNPLYNIIKKMFDNPDAFTAGSRDLTSHLYEVAIHPQIKPGDIFVVKITGLELDGKPADAIGIYKSETRQSFLKVSATGAQFQLKYEDGIGIEKVDKACLVFNTAPNDGYRMLIVDKVSKTNSAQYWKDLFLNAKPAGDEFNYTSQVMSITKDYVTKQYVNEFDVSKADQIDLLNRSADYFKTHDTYNRKEFEEEVLHHPDMIQSFRSFNDQYSVKNDVDIVDDFSISKMAVGKQAKIFKSVLKLDKNFHIYIHGDRDLIEKGTDKDGRKYYKIYYDSES
jgi:hypothetical protein